MFFKHPKLRCRKLILIVTMVLITILAAAGAALAVAPAYTGMFEKGNLVSSPERLQVTVIDAQNGFNPESVVMLIDGVIVSPMIYPFSSSYVIEYKPVMPFADNSFHDVTVMASDDADNFGLASWNFGILSPPVISNIVPQENSSVENDTNSADISFHVHDDNGVDPLSIHIKVDSGEWVTPVVSLSNDQKDATVTYRAVYLVDGLHKLDIQARDIFGTPAEPIQWTQNWGYQFFWHYKGDGPYDGAVYNQIPLPPVPPATVSQYINESETVRFSATCFFRDGFGDTYKPSYQIYYPNTTYPYLDPTLLYSINPVSYTIFNNNHEETAFVDLVLGGTVPGTTRKFTEGVYKVGVNFLNVRQVGTGMNFWKFNLISGYPKAAEIYPAPGTMVVSPAGPTVSVRATDPGYGASGAYASYLTLTDNGILVSYPTRTQLGLDASISKTITTTGFHNIAAGLQDKAKNSSSETFAYYYKTQTGTGPVFKSVFPMDYNLPGVAENGYGVLEPDENNQVSITVKVNDSNLIADNDSMVIRTPSGATLPYTRTFSYGGGGLDQTEAVITYTFNPPTRMGVYNYTLTVKDQTNTASTLTSNFVVKADTKFELISPAEFTADTTPGFSVKVTDFTGIDANSLIVTVDDNLVTPDSVVPCANGYIISYTPFVPLDAGTAHTFRVSVQANDGTAAASPTWTTNIVAPPPEQTNVNDSSGGQAVPSPDSGSGEVSPAGTAPASPPETGTQMSATANEAMGVCQTCHTRGLGPAKDFKYIHFIDQPQMTGSMWYGHAQRCYGCHHDIQLRYPNDALRNKCQICHNFPFGDNSGDPNWNYFNLFPDGGFFSTSNTLGDGYNEWPWDFGHGKSSNWSYSDRSDTTKYSVNAPREGLDCIYCHQNDKNTAGSTPVAGHDLVQAHAVQLDGQECVTCHSSILTVEHAKPSAIDKDHNGAAINCNTCHKSTRADVLGAIQNYSQLGHWNYMADAKGLISGNLNNRAVYESPEYSIPGKKLTKGTLQISSNDDATWYLKAYYDGEWHTVYSTAVNAFKYQYPSYVAPRGTDGLVNWPTGSTTWIPMTTGMSPWMKYEVTFPKPVEKIKYAFTLFRGDTSYRMRNIVKFTDYGLEAGPDEPVVTCRSCHASTVNHLEAHQNAPLDSGCQTCHNAAITLEHLSNSTTSGKNYDCATCHANTSTPVKRTITASSSICAGCHREGHNMLFVEQVPADIPLYTGFIWSTPVEASIFTGESASPEGYGLGQVVISSRRTDVTTSQVWDFYNAQLTANGWTVRSGPVFTAQSLTAEFEKAGRFVTVSCYNMEAGGQAAQADTGYRIEIWYK